MHIDKFEKYVKEGYKGMDADLETSLYEYGLIWKEEEDEFRFVYGVDLKQNEYRENEFILFDWGTVQKDVRPTDEWNWVDWESLLKFNGMSSEEFFNRPVPFIVSDLLDYYGYMDVLGEAYHPFKIQKTYPIHLWRKNANRMEV